MHYARPVFIAIMEALCIWTPFMLAVAIWLAVLTGNLPQVHQ